MIELYYNGMTLLDMIKRFPNEEACVAYLEKVRWPKSKPICPYCGHVSSEQKRHDGRYMCGSCNKPFRVTVGTIFHKTRVPLQKWFLFIVLMLNAKKGVSSYQLSRDCELNQKTAWYMGMRVRKAMGSDQGPLLQGIVEIDETYIGGKPRKPNKGNKSFAGGKANRNPNKSRVIGMMERKGNVKARTMETLNKENIREFINEFTDDATIYSDSAYVYRKVVDKIVDHGKCFVNKEGTHTNNIESFWAIVKRGIFGQFHHIKRKYLDAYLSEFCYKFNRRSVDCAFDETLQWMIRA